MLEKISLLTKMLYLTYKSPIIYNQRMILVKLQR